MRKMTILDRILLLIIGVLLFAVLLFIIFGFAILDSKLVVIVAATIPLILSMSLIAEYLPNIRTISVIFAGVGILAIAVTRYATPGIVATVVLAVVHGIAGVLLVFMKLGKPILSRDTIFTVLPGLLLLMTVAFVAGLAMR